MSSLILVGGKSKAEMQADALKHKMSIYILYTNTTASLLVFREENGSFTERVSLFLHQKQ